MSGTIVNPLSLKMVKLNASSGYNFSRSNYIANLDKLSLLSPFFWVRVPSIEPEMSRLIERKIGKFSGLGTPSLHDFVNNPKKVSGYYKYLVFASLSMFR